MESALFRAQALAWQHDSRYGTVMLSRPLSTRVLTWLLSALTLSAIAFLALSSYTSKVSVSGSLAPDTGLVAVPAPVTGTVAELDVAEGDSVAEGDRLLVLVQDRMLEDSGMLGESLQRNLDERKQGIRTRLALLLGRRDMLEREKSAREHHQQQVLQGYLQLLAGEQATLVLRRNALARVLQLQADGHLATADLDAARLKVIEQEQVLSNVQRQQHESEAQLSALQFEYEQKQLELEQEEAALADEALRLSQQQIQQRAEHRIEIRAPVSGDIGSLSIHRGMTLAGGEQLLSLVPRDSRLVAALAIPSKAMGFVSKGQAVNLHIDAFPYQKFGIQHGRVLGFDTAALVQPPGPGQLPVAEYRLIAELESQSVSAYGNEHALLAGMQLSADILVDRRTLLEWLFEPLLGSGR